MGESQPEVSAAPMIVVIDDEEVMREGVAEILTLEGYRVAKASGGAEGLVLVEELAPDIVLVDLRMPGLGGLEVIEEIARERPTTVIIVITGYATIDHVVESIRCGAFDLLPKPFAPADLRLSIRRGLGRRKVMVELEALRTEKRRLTDYYTSIVSHQLRTPIAATRQYFEVILGGHVGEVSPGVKQLVERMSIRLTELSELIEDWLSLARLDEEGLQARFQPLELQALIRQRLEELAPQISARQVVVELELDERAPTLNGHRGSIAQVIDNLLSNAVKYGRPGGRLGVRLVSPEGFLVLTVEDDGLGIAEEHLPFLFNEFYRVKTRETRDIMGTGLGLTIVRKFVEAHLGTVSVKSQLGRGSTFTLRLPVARGVTKGAEA